MATKIHPTAVIDPKAQIGENVEAFLLGSWLRTESSFFIAPLPFDGRAAVDNVISGTAVQDVVAAPSVQPIVTGVSVQSIRALLTEEAIIAVTPIQFVVSVGVENVRATAIDNVITPAAFDPVASPTTLQSIV